MGLWKEHAVYRLFDPRDTTRVVRYVGCTEREVDSRVDGHLASIRNPVRHEGVKPYFDWLTDLADHGIRPDHDVVFRSMHRFLALEVEAAYQVQHATTILNSRMPKVDVVTASENPVANAVVRLMIQHLRSQVALAKQRRRKAKTVFDRNHAEMDAERHAETLKAIRVALNMNI